MKVLIDQWLATRRKILLTRVRFFAYLLETPDGPLC